MAKEHAALAQNKVEAAIRIGRHSPCPARAPRDMLNAVRERHGGAVAGVGEFKEVHRFVIRQGGDAPVRDCGARQLLHRSDLAV